MLLHQSGDTVSHVLINLYRPSSTPLVYHQLVSRCMIDHAVPPRGTSIVRAIFVYMSSRSVSSNAPKMRCLSTAEMWLRLRRSDATAEAQPKLSSLTHIGARFRCFCSVFPVGDVVAYKILERKTVRGKKRYGKINAERHPERQDQE